MVDFGEALSYAVGVFSIVFGAILLAGYVHLLDTLQSSGIQISIEVRSAILLVYLVFGLLGSSQIWLGLLHRRVVDLERDLVTLSNDLARNTKSMEDLLERVSKTNGRLKNQ